MSGDLPTNGDAETVMVPIGTRAGDHVFFSVTAGRLFPKDDEHPIVSIGTINTSGGPRPLCAALYVVMPHDITSTNPLVPDESYALQAAGYTDLGTLSFLYAGYHLTAYSGIKRVRLDTATTSGQTYHPESFPGAGDGSDPAKVHTPLPVPGGYDSAWMIVASTNGTVGGHPEADELGAWDFRNFDQQGRAGHSHYTWVSLDPDVPELRIAPGPEIHVSGTRPNWDGFAVALERLSDTKRPVTRQWPRDSLGLASAPRIFPPPRTNRVVGGHD